MLPARGPWTTNLVGASEYKAPCWPSQCIDLGPALWAGSNAFRPISRIGMDTGFKICTHRADLLLH